MKALLDTSVIIAGLYKGHAHHAQSHAWLDRGRRKAQVDKLVTLNARDFRRLETQPGFVIEP